MNLHKAIPVFAGTYSQQFGIKVHLADKAETDGDAIYLPRNYKDPELVLAFLAHESAHILYTDFSVELLSELHGHLVNLMEDYRIEKRFLEEYPGVLGVFDQLVSMHTAGDISKLSNPINVVISYIWYHVRIEMAGYSNPYPEMKPQLHARLIKDYGQDFVDDLEAYINNVRHSRHTADVSEIAIQVISLLRNQNESNDSSNTDNSDSSDSDESSDERECGDSAENSDSNSSSDSDSSNDEENDEVSGQESKSSNSEQENSSQDNQSSEDQSEEKGSESSHENTENSSKEGESDVGENAENEDQDSDGDNSGSTGSKAESDESDDSEHEQQDTNEAGGSETDEQSSKQFDVDNFTGNSGDIGDLIAAMINDDLDAKDQGMRGHEAVPESEMPHVMDDLSTSDSVCQDFVEECNSVTSYLRQSIKRILEDEVKVTRQAKRHGKRLYRSRLSRIPMGETRIFAKKTQTSHGYDAFVTVLTDVSGSMGDDVKHAKQATYSLLAALNNIEGVKTSAFAFGLDRGEGIGLIKGQEERNLYAASNRLASLTSMGNTPAYSAYWAAIHQIVAAKKSDNIVVMMTDGMPNDPEGTKEVVDLLKDNGVKVVCLGVGSGFHTAWADVVYGYGNSIHIRNFAELPETLLKVTKQMLLN